jgi:hypothetical protein
MELKSKPNRRAYIQALARMTPAQRLAKAMELSELANQLFLHGLRRRYPGADEKQILAEYLARTARFHYRNY